MKRHAHRIGAACYALWGLLHVWAGADLLRAGVGDQLALLSTGPLAAEELPPGLAPIVHAALSFHAYNLLWFGVFALVVSLALNWRNSWIGYWVNLAVVGADDVGLLLFLILPGHLSVAEAGLGPVLFALAALFSTIGVLQREARSA